MIIRKKKICLPFNFLFLNNSSLLFLKSNYTIVCIRLNLQYFFKIYDRKISFLFLHYFYFKSFLSKIYSQLTKTKVIYFFKLRLIGLGFRLLQVSKNLYYFYFTTINYFYFYVPLSVIFKVRIRKIFCVSKNLRNIQELLVGLLTLKKFFAYKFVGLTYPRRIYVLKRGKKKF
jgi:hypothetical protein